MSEERDDFEEWANAMESFVANTSGIIACYDKDMKVVALDATEFVLDLIATHRQNRRALK